MVGQSRNQTVLTRYLPELVPALQAIKPKRLVLDGEIVVFTGFGTDFDAMTNRIHPAASRVKMLSETQPASYIAFDLLADGDESLLEVPLRERRRRLESLLGQRPGSIFLSPATIDRDIALGWLTEYRGTGLDRLVATRLCDVYPPAKRAMIQVQEQRPAVCAGAGSARGQRLRRVRPLTLALL